MKRILLFCLLALASHTIVAQDQNVGGGKRGSARGYGSVYGMVLDEKSGLAVEYANIILYSQKDSTMITGGVTDSDGKFAIQKVPFGMYYLTADFIGYAKTYRDKINVQSGKPDVEVGDIRISPGSYSLDQVEVVADKLPFEYKIDKKVVNVSQNLKSASGTAVDVLENTPSVDVDIEGNVSIRGSENFQVLINGRPSVLEGSDALQQIPARTIESIEIITNPSAKYDPDGTGGILNVITKKEEDPGLTGLVNLGMGTNNKYSGNILLNQRLGKFNIYGGFDYRSDDFSMDRESERRTGYKDTTTFLESNDDRTMHRGGYNIKFGIDWYISKKTTLGFSGEYGSFEFGFSGNGKNHEWIEPGDSSIYYKSESEMKRPRGFYRLNTNLTHNFNKPGHKIEASLYWSDREGTSEDKTLEWLTDANWNNLETLNSINSKETGDSKEIRANLDYTLPFDESSHLQAGFQSRIENDDEVQTFERYVENVGWVEDDAFSSSSDYDREIWAAYTIFSDEIESMSLGYQLGLRGEYTLRGITDSRTGSEFNIDRFDLFPSMHLSKQLPNDNQLMMSYSRRIDRPRGRYLDPFKRYKDIKNFWQGNPDLKPEYVNSYELSYLKKWGSTFFSFETFYRHTENRITRILTPMEDGMVLHTVENLNEDHRLGGELMFSSHLGKKLNFNISGSLYFYKLDGELSSENVVKESTNYNAHFNTTYKFLPSSRAQLMLRYRGPSASLQGTYEGMFMSDLAIRHDFFNRKASATLQIRDLFGTAKREFTADQDDYYEHIMMQRESQIVQLTLSYRINNYQQDGEKNRKLQENTGEEMDYGY
mgnify:CR=1 FL=1